MVKNPGGETMNPAQKPAELLRYLIEGLTNQYEIVVDLCAGISSFFF
jgi:hypothetical protein